VPLLALALVAWPRPASPGPITFNTALPVHSGEWIVRQQTVWLRATGDPGSERRELSVLVAPTVVVHGLDSRVALFAIQPFLSKQLEAATPTGRVTRAVTGFGDLMVLARVTALAVDRTGETIRVAPFAGLELPTGRDLFLLRLRPREAPTQAAGRDERAGGPRQTTSSLRSASTSSSCAPSPEKTSTRPRWSIF
jgi:hypothetical protein